MIRFRAEEGTCSVRTRQGRYDVRIARREGGLEHPLPQGGEARRPLLLAYGCRRGSALGSPTQNVLFEPPTLALATLFDESARVINAEAWIKELQRQGLSAKEKEDPSKQRVYEAVCATLTKILDVERVECRDDGVWVKFSEADEVPIASLSDGYITTTGWVADLMARWLERARRRGEVIDEGFTQRMEGVALVDEIDQHLHPRWQCRVIQSVRETFPKMTFVVTTHNPLTLLGARPGEIFVLRRGPHAEATEGAITIEQVDLPEGARADHVLTGPWFGLSSVLLDPKARDLLAEQRKLLRKRGVTAEERKAMEAKVIERLSGSVDTSLERLVLGVAAEIMDERYRELTPEERANVLTPEERAGLRAEVKERSLKQLDEESKANEGKR